MGKSLLSRVRYDSPFDRNPTDPRSAYKADHEPGSMVERRQKPPCSAAEEPMVRRLPWSKPHAQIGGDVDCCSFTAVDFHHILFAGLPAHSLALRPAHSRGHQFVTRYPRASDISSPPCLPRLLPAGANRRVGLAPTGKRRLVTAHPQSSHCREPIAAPQLVQSCHSISVTS
jgi:hypothetical protein